MDGFILPERDQGSVFKEEWERQVWGLAFGLDIPGYSRGGRAVLEKIPPELYLSLPYCARWLYRSEKSLIAQGIVTESEFANPDGPIKMPDIPDYVPLSGEQAVMRLASDDSAELEAEVEPLFVVGDKVIVKNEHPTYHNRVPRYVRGRQGFICRHHGVHIFQDQIGEDIGQQHLYTVKFKATELWGSRAHSNDHNFVELWDYHLQPAPDND
jgi:nitrile hydratase